jgi:hypothetical protein
MKPRNELANDYHNRLPEGPFQKSFVHGAFVNGYDAGYQAAQQWISVKERLPPPETEVLWWNETAHQAGVSSWEYNSYCNDTMIYWGDAGNVSIKNFTHWQPLPKPPEEK